MPTPIEKLWELVESKRFSEIKEHIHAHKDANLINALESDGDRTLPIYLLNMMAKIKEANLKTLLHFLLYHPQMDWKFVSKFAKQTASHAVLDAALEDDDFSVIESLKDVSGFIFNGKLAYEIAADRLKSLERILVQGIENKSSMEVIEKRKARRDKCIKAVALIRDITILHAIKTDNADLMDRLDKSGGRPLAILGNFGGEIMPSFSLIGVAQPNLRIKAWREDRSEKNFANGQDERNAIIQNSARHAFFVAEQKRIEQEHALAELAIRERAAKERMARINAAVTIATEEERRTTSATTGCSCVIS